MHDANDGVICSNQTELCRNNAGTLLSTSIFLMNDTISSSEFDRCDANNFDTFNCTAAEYLLYQRGETVANFWFRVPVTIVDLIILLAGIFGNAAVCIIIVRNQSMHTNTNYYLFNLAVADLLYLLFGLPFEIHMFWHQYPWLFGSTFCKFRSLVTEACSYASVLTIVAFSVERYIAICHPLYSYVMANLKRVIYEIALIWLLSFGSASPVTYYRYVQFIRYPPPDGNEMPDSGICTMQTEITGLYEASTLLFFIIPLLILIIMYARIALQLNNRVERRQNGRFGKISIDANTKQVKSRNNIVRMLIAIVITFFISWSPFHAQRLVFVYGKQWPEYVIINEILFTFGGFFYYLSCAINPIIYNIMSHRYRIAFRQTFCCVKKKVAANKKPRTWIAICI